MEHKISSQTLDALKAAQAALEQEWQRLRPIAWQLQDQADLDPDNKAAFVAANEAHNNVAECKIQASYIALFFKRIKIPTE